MGRRGYRAAVSVANPFMRFIQLNLYAVDRPRGEDRKEGRFGDGVEGPAVHPDRSDAFADPLGILHVDAVLRPLNLRVAE